MESSGTTTLIKLEFVEPVALSFLNTVLYVIAVVLEEPHCPESPILMRNVEKRDNCESGGEL